MTIRTKIFLLAGTLLAMFGMVVGVVAIVQKLNSDQIGNVATYELPLSRIIAQFDVYTDRYELDLLRVLRLETASPTELSQAAAATEALAGELRADVGMALKLLAQATHDPHYNSATRVDLARIEGTLKYLSRNLAEFLMVGDHMMAALKEGRREDAQKISLEFVKFAQAFGPDLSEIRRAVADITDRSTAEVLAREEFDTYLSFTLFVVACCIGLGISTVGSSRVIAGLRELVANIRTIETGGRSQPVVIQTRDEVGELSLSFNRMIEELRIRERVKETFGKFIDPRIVTRLIGDGADHAERRTLTVFFSDIEGFTGISEQLTASAVVNLLNSYFGAVATVIHAHRGVIDKYIGDAVMAFWTPPFSSGDDHAGEACLAALAQQDAVNALRAQLPEITGMRRNPPKLVIRMGIATGEGVVGTIGSEASRSYTVIGDTVNLASRIEGINKVYGTSIVLSDETHRLAQNVIETREIDLITVAGKTEPVRIHELMGRAGELSAEQSDLRDRFASGLAAYRRQDWDEAQTHFEGCLAAKADDGPTQLFLKRILLLRTAPPPSDWGGVWHLTEK
jgi:adenylate cyclase